MRVLVLHNRYKILGGEDLSTDAEVKLLKENGVDVDVLYVNNADIAGKNRLGLALKSIWSQFYYRKVIKMIEENRYDLVHVQNFFPLLSPSIFYAAKKSRTKVVMSVRNYRLVCPNAMMYIDNGICKLCVGKSIPYPAVQKKCYRNSRLTSAAVAAMLSFHNLIKTWNKSIDGYICVSDYVRNQLVQGGVDAGKMFVKHNFIATTVPPSLETGHYFIYVGRLSAEKGIDMLLDEFKSNGKKLLIVGEGPMKDVVINAVNGIPNIEYLGKKPLIDIYNLISMAAALVFTSRWHEPFGRTIVEAFAHGTPVIASALGGVTELIVEGKNGFLFDAYKPGDLRRAIDLFESVSDKPALRQGSYESYRQNFLPENNFSKLLSIYQQVIG